jgi:lipopolysaccharide/colanic/teichoic acid biosynthesis glycosyltransferase
MTRDEEAFRMMAASAGAQLPTRNEPPTNGRKKKLPDPVDEMLVRETAVPVEPAASEMPSAAEPEALVIAPEGDLYPDIPKNVVAGPTPPAKRWMDVAIASVAIGVLSPVFAMAALLIKLESPGPVLIKQKRVGLNGKPFYFYKFRSMVHRKKQDDMKDRLPKGDLRHRILSPLGRPLNATKVGWTLRKTTVDELPQLLNVVRGDMSLVGPRPDLPEIVEQWPESFRQRHLVKPGMTGLAQVNGRSDLTHHEKVKHDLVYVRDHSLKQDVRILLKTIGLVISKKGAR